MNQESKDLLFQDLCARLPYGVKYSCIDIKNVWRLKTIFTRSDNSIFCDGCNDLELCRPYLFPLSSMTEEQRTEASFEVGLKKYKVNIFGNIESYSEIGDDIAYIDLENIRRYIDWLNKNHFDYNGLIEKGLAIDATGLNIY